MSEFVIYYSALEKKIPVCARLSSSTIIVYDFTRSNLQPFKGIFGI